MEQIMAFPLCEQTVTVYRMQDATLLRQVVNGCFFKWEDARQGDTPWLSRPFLLVIPGDFPLRPGDRVFPGEGPETVEPAQFVPAAVEGLGQVGYVKHYPTHIEAGYKRSV